MTLIEVIASVAILSTLLVGMLQINRRHTKQIRLANEKKIAIELADGLLAEWFSSPEPFPAPATGVCDVDGYWWRTELAAIDASNLKWQTSKVVLRIWSPTSDEPVVAIEFLNDAPIRDLRLGEP